MDVILHQLGELLLKAVPTFLIVVLLNFYLKAVFFKPLERVLHRRYEQTEGARKLAEESLQRAAQKTAQYEAALRTARGQVYHAQEELHKRLQERHAAQIADARRQADELIKDAREQLSREVEAAKAGLERDSELLANEIAESILRRSAA